MLKILHTADLHIGAKFKFLGDKGNLQRLELLNCLDKIVALAIKREVDLVIFAGDLFDTNRPSTSSLIRVKNAMKKMVDARIWIVLVPGTHDGADDNFYADFEIGRSQNPLIFSTSRHETLPDFDLTLYSYIARDKVDQNDFLRALTPHTDSRFHIGTAHGNLSRGGLISTDPLFWEDSIEKTGLDYLALGHWHSFELQKIGRTTVCYPGSPEFISISQPGFGSAALVKMDESSVKVEKIPLSERVLIEKEIRVDDLENQDYIVNSISRITDTKAILHLKLTGLRRFNIDPLELQDYLKDSFFYFKLEDLTHPAQIDPESLGGRPLIEAYVKEIRERIKEAADEPTKARLEEALLMGVMLLEGKKVLK